MNRRAFLKNGIWVLAAPAIILPKKSLAQSRLYGAKRAAFAEAPPAASGITYLINEQFESGSGAFSNVGGANNLNYAYTTTVLKGSKSAASALLSDGEGLATFAANGTIEASCLFQIQGVITGDAYVFLLEDNAANILCAGVIDHTTKQITVKSLSDVGGTTTSAVSLNTTYEYFFRYVKGTGSNGFMSVEFQPSPFTRSGSGNNYCQLTTGAATANCSQIRLISVDVAQTMIWDNALVSTQSIPSNPP